ncbi:MAG: response regulator [Acidobacteria bacterium]|nr:MAG: response regulator [Acidobacteriota bacterium]
MFPFLAAASDGRKSSSASSRRIGAETGKQPPTILVVDDDDANLVLARALLESEGFRVVTAIDAISTFDALKEIEPALILMDVQLPGMDGWELTRRLSKNIATSHIPIIALTAYGKHGDEQRAREAGFVEFVSKPVSTRELPAIIRRHLPR